MALENPIGFFVQKFSNDPPIKYIYIDNRVFLFTDIKVYVSSIRTSGEASQLGIGELNRMSTKKM